MKLQLRSDVMHAKDPKTIFLARNIVCDETVAIDTGFKPFSSEDASTDFKITMKLSAATHHTAQAVVIGCKYEGTTGGQQWPGFYVRFSNATTFEIGGYNYWKSAISTVVGHNLCIWRKSGSWKAQIDDGTVQNLSVRVATFDQPIVIGAGLQTNGTYFRYANCVYDYIRIEYI